MTDIDPKHATPNGTTNGDKQQHHNHPPPVIVQETDDEDDVIDDVMNGTTAIELLELDEETLNSGAEGYVKLILYKRSYLDCMRL